MTERRILVALISVIVSLGLVSAIAAGELAGFVYPGDFLIWTVVLAAGGVLVLRARPGHSIGRLFLWAAFMSSLTFASFQFSLSFFPEYVFDQGTETYPAGTPMWFQVADGVLSIGYAFANVLVVAAFARFPEGHWVSRGVKWLFWVSVPLQLAANLNILPGAAVLPVLLIAGAIFRRSLSAGPLHRRQVAWVLIGYGLYLLIGISSLALPEGIPPEWLVVSSILLFPLGMVLAITRYKLFELDRIVSRTASYVVVVAVLLVVYFGLVVLLRSLIPVQDALPVALSTLAVAFAFFPLARRVQAWVDRRFFRSRYDSAEVVGAFADELRVTVDRDSLVERTVSVVGSTFNAESVDVWLAEESP